MAAPADVGVRLTDRSGLGGELDQIRTQLNNLVAAVRVLCAKMDADAGITDTNYFALVADSAASGAAKVVATLG